jgi:hypothetical protein
MHLRVRAWVFVRFLGQPSGIITHGDLQKAPMRMWLFGLISLLEMQMLRCIRGVGKDDNWWQELLTENRLKMAKKTFALRQEKNEEIYLSDCLQIVDKVTIFRKCDELFVLTHFESKIQWKRQMGGIEELRNNLAHSNDFGVKPWSEIADLVIKIKEILQLLESDGVPQ